jgi:hypothetical protein
LIARKAALHHGRLGSAKLPTKLTNVLDSSVLAIY